MIFQLWKYHKIPLLFIGLSIVLYFVFAYDLTRDEFPKLVALYISLFITATGIVKTCGFNFRLLVIASVILRVVFIVATPNLSQDFYRFIWDGRLFLEGYNPYLHTPDALLNSGIRPVAQTQELYSGMGSLSASHYTNYPPINQLLFSVAAIFSGKSITGAIVILRLIIVAADMGTLYFGKKLLEALKLPSTRIFWYILNPFIIIELTGNLHFEGVMIFFLVWSLYLLQSRKWPWAAVILALSISVKLIPIMFLPLFYGWFVKKPENVSALSKKYFRLIGFYAIVGTTVILTFLPFFSMEFITNYSKTIGLWFNAFEFNASIYYIARAVGFWVTGYNEIAVIGKILPVVSTLCILGFTFLRTNDTTQKLTTSIVLAFTVYLFFSTTVHPWYLTTLIALCIFTNYRYPIVWTLVIVLSYFAYSNSYSTENLWIISLEYLVVFSVFIWEVILGKRIKL